MKTKPNELPIGARVSVHHMPKEYYAKWEKLRNAEKQAYAKARSGVVNSDYWKAWERASKRLADHENKHDTN